MINMKKTIITVLVTTVVLFGFYKLTSQKPATTNPTNTDYQNSDIVMFYGITCPHCKIVEEFIFKNQIDQKLKINQLEVYENQTNQAIFTTMVKDICPDKFSPEGLSIPFLINPKDKQCIIGDTPITDYLTEKTK